MYEGPKSFDSVIERYKKNKEMACINKDNEYFLKIANHIEKYMEDVRNIFLLILESEIKDSDHGKELDELIRVYKIIFLDLDLALRKLERWIS